MTARDNRPPIRTSRLAILAYYLTEAAKPDEEWSESSINGGPPERETYPSIVQQIGRKLHRNKPQCFACHMPFRTWRSGLERAHIVAWTIGGKDVPENYVLLCPDCHRNAPMTNRDYWMLEWVDRGPAAQGWAETDSLQAATDAEMLAVLNYGMPEARRLTSLRGFVGFTLAGADLCDENIRRTNAEVAEDVEADMHWGAANFSPATSALVILETMGRVCFMQPRDKARERTSTSDEPPTN